MVVHKLNFVTAGIVAFLANVFNVLCVTFGQSEDKRDKVCVKTETN